MRGETPFIEFVGASDDRDRVATPAQTEGPIPLFSNPLDDRRGQLTKADGTAVSEFVPFHSPTDSLEAR